MARILSRRADGAPLPVPPVADAAPADAPATGAVAAGEAGSPLAADGPGGDGTAVTQVLPVRAADPDATAEADGLPAAAAPDPERRPSFRARGPLRRRLRYLRRVRELGFRDLGGLVFDLDRFGRDRGDLVRAKLDALRAIDSELRALELALRDPRPVEELHEPGISACARCGGLHGSEARFCPSCGTPVGSPPTAIELPAAAPQGTAVDEPATDDPVVPEAAATAPAAAAALEAELADAPVPGPPAA